VGRSCTRLGERRSRHLRLGRLGLWRRRGVNGNGGAAADGAGGAGWLSNGASILNYYHGYSVVGGSGPPTFDGGINCSDCGVDSGIFIGGNGGFGGGGGGGYNGGGGGGYSGGGGGGNPDDPFDSANGGGGGSYLNSSFSNLVEEVGVGTGNGLVDINSTVFGFSGQIAYYVVPITGVYDIVAIGAEGGGGFGPVLGRGYGAEVGGDIVLEAGTRLEIIVGGEGTYGPSDGAFGGGGGSFVAIVPEISTWAMMLLGFAGLGVIAARASRSDRRVGA
jgi:hypothetical protein